VSTVTFQATSCGEFLQPTKLAPIALFVYNRVEHARRTVNSLEKNDLARQSDLFVFADGTRNEADAARIQEVRKFARGIEGFRSVTIIDRERNFGLSDSIISGITQLCHEFGRAIAVEDDIVTAPDFLTFMNRGLERYRDEPKVFSINGFNFAIATPACYPCDAYFSYRSNSWGWGTWKDRWDMADWSVKDFPQFISDPERQARFNRGGTDLTGGLVRSVVGKLHGSWDIVWAYTHSKHDAVALRPVVSKVLNIGFDGSGTHCRRKPFGQVALTSGSNPGYRFPGCVEPDAYFAAEILRLHRRSAARNLARYFVDKLGLR
jgi:hypothetical protein